MAVPLRLLLVEDSEDDALLLVRELRRSGLDVTHERVDRRETMESALNRQPWDLVIGDYSMPDFGGDAALALLRQRDADIPFIFVSGTIGEEAAVAAMRVGANDYIIKGKLGRLVPAIQREMRDAEARRERKRAEQALRESEARYRELVENSTYAIYRSGMEARILEANPAMAGMLGYGSAAELLTLNLRDDVYTDPVNHGRVVEHARQNGRFQGLEAEWKRRDGQSIRVRLACRLVHGQNGDDGVMEMIAEDITERSRLEKQVAVLQKLEAVGRLAGGVAHDFNNLIGAILGWTDLGLKDTVEGSASRRYFENIYKNGKVATDLVRQLLAFARNQPLEPANLDLNAVVTDVLTLLGGTLARDVQISTKLQPGLDVIRADATQVQQVIMNLAINARDAMPNGGKLLLETSNFQVDEEYKQSHSYAKPGHYVLLSVTDTGTGMDAATQEKIFEPFFTTKEVGKGTGLGLATVYGVVKQHGGFINVYSELGTGTTFRIYWPVGHGPAKPAAPVEKKGSTKGTETLLLAEDNEGLREIAGETLEPLGYNVLFASDGEEAVQIFRKNADKIALAILDVTMPRLSGADAYTQMTAIKPDLPVIFATGYSTELDSLRALAEEGAEILQKPYTPGSLARQVRQILDRQK